MAHTKAREVTITHPEKKDNSAKQEMLGNLMADEVIAWAAGLNVTHIGIQEMYKKIDGIAADAAKNHPSMKDLYRIAGERAKRRVLYGI